MGNTFVGDQERIIIHRLGAIRSFGKTCRVRAMAVGPLRPAPLSNSYGWGFHFSGVVKRPLSATCRTFLPSVSTSHRLTTRRGLCRGVSAKNRTDLPSGRNLGDLLPQVTLVTPRGLGFVPSRFMMQTSY